jgi:SNF2 family DNA or RNA helicase
MKLYPFQQELVDKLRDVPAALVGDEMGLGKTVEAIALDMARRKQYNAPAHWKTLVVAPASVLGSWERHFRKMCPDLKVKVIDPKNRLSLVYALKHHKATVFIVHWPVLRLMPELADAGRWFHVIGDEIHLIKNRDAQQTQAFKKLEATFKLGLSGTPADDKPQDLWSVLNWLYPKKFTSYWTFFRKYVKSVTHTPGPMMCAADDCFKKHKRQFRETTGVNNVEELHALLAPFYVRRLKENELEDLPDKYYTEIDVPLHPKQWRAYVQMRDRMLAWIGEHEEEPVAAPAVISQLVRLQQFACAYGKMVKVTKRRRDCQADTCETGCVGHIVDALQLTEPSSKIDAVLDMVESTNGQIVVFATQKQVINLLVARLERAGITVCTLTGDTPQGDRDQLVEDFQQGKYQVFCGTITAGGIGITLTAASTVVFMDRTWNPSKNKQAEDRLHRVGQKNAVQVITLRGVNTLDAERNELIELKWERIRALLGETKRG